MTGDCAQRLQAADSGNTVSETVSRIDRGSPPNMPKPKLAPEILASALHGLEAQRARFDAHIELRRANRDIHDIAIELETKRSAVENKVRYARATPRSA